MPVPPEYERASERFYSFLVDAREAAGLATTHQTYTMVQGVLRAFRRRLDVADALRFADLLPPLLRALFVTDWDARAPRAPFVDRATMTAEVRSLRAAHNFSPDDAIEAVAVALRRHVDAEAFDALLRTLPDGAVDFWRPPGQAPPDA